MKLRAVGETLVIAALACLPAIGQGFYFRNKVSWESPIPAPELVTVEQARTWGDGAIWVDARPDDEFARAHVPGAFSLNEDRWNELLPQFLPNWSPAKKVVVYCSAQSCNAARDVAKRLRDEAQLKDVFVLQGGWEEWEKKNR
ncbi:MAG TPA: rhodanese-like domain-containing protein [Chthoniobacterales bacterium]|nr:rhodanese-like domain-containing protein [Chthoniobacterales bacterium]